MSLLKVAGTTASSGTLYVDDVFSVYLYTGNGSTQTITNGIDLAGEGGLVWIKDRSAGRSHALQDTVNGVTKMFQTNNTNTPFTESTSITSFNNDGFSLGSYTNSNASSETFASWAFRKAAKFFDVVTFTTNSSGLASFSHSLGIPPGMIAFRAVSGTNNWNVYHRSLSSTTQLFLNTTDSAQSTGITFLTVSSTNVVGGTTAFNASATYVAYLFAHDTSSTGIIQCGSFTADGSGNATVNLGWEPQYLLMKNSTSVNDWYVFDSMRGFSMTSEASLAPNSSAAETPWVPSLWVPTATGFQVKAVWPSLPTIYMAIRMPNKPPTSGTQVYNAIARTGTGAAATVTGVGFPSDLVFIRNKNGALGQSAIFTDRLRGVNNFIYSGATAAEINVANVFTGLDSEDGYYLGSDSGGYGTNYNAMPFINWSFKRAPGFFDEVCYTGTGVATTQAHNLGVAPEMIIVKARSAATEGEIYVAPLGNDMAVNLFGASGAAFTTGGIAWNYTTPTSSVFSLGTWNKLNGSGVTFVAYLFATLAGISKVGSYTGNGTGQVIACGFGAAGARFVLIKRTDAAGGWYTFDSARGLTVGSSPYLLLNSTAAEVTGNNGVYASTGGFTLDATAITTTNIATATYIFLAVA